MAEPKGQGAHTLKEPKPTFFSGGWWTVCDRWPNDNGLPRGYGIMVCGCDRQAIDGTPLGVQKWVLPRHPWRGRAPVPSPTGKEGDKHVLCGVPFTRIYPR